MPRPLTLAERTHESHETEWTAHRPRTGWIKPGFQPSESPRSHDRRGLPAWRLLPSSDRRRLGLGQNHRPPHRQAPVSVRRKLHRQKFNALIFFYSFRDMSLRRPVTPKTQRSTYIVEALAMNAPRSRRALCSACSLRSGCATICPALQRELPSMSRGRIPTLNELFTGSHRHGGRGR